MFLLLFLLVFVAASILAELEWFIGAAIVVAAGVAGVHFLHLADVLTFVRDNLAYIGAGSAIYVAAGAAWAFAKWLMQVRAFLDHVEEIRDQFESSHSFSVNEDVDAAFKKHLSERFDYFRGFRVSKKPKVINNKGRMIAWMTLWPWSIVGTFFNDFVRKIFVHLFNRMRGTLQSITDRMLKDASYLAD